jgi:hypothetical protein
MVVRISCNSISTLKIRLTFDFCRETMESVNDKRTGDEPATLGSNAVNKDAATEVESPQHKVDVRFWVAFWALGITNLAAALDATTLSVALPVFFAPLPKSPYDTIVLTDSSSLDDNYEHWRRTDRGFLGWNLIPTGLHCCDAPLGVPEPCVWSTSNTDRSSGHFCGRISGLCCCSKLHRHDCWPHYPGHRWRWSNWPHNGGHYRSGPSQESSSFLCPDQYHLGRWKYLWSHHWRRFKFVRAVEMDFLVSCDGHYCLN